jgi:hypothetical protein
MSEFEGIEVGTAGKERIFVGATKSYYDYATKPLSGTKMHILVFTLEEAKDVVRFLKKEIRRKERVKTT